ncbi:hypothetical protein FPFC_012070 [Fructobacillus pseudoficulneus]|uniref:Uncharacterized protein n=1 Tax=Fructobacillus pseudoficulneus TaxID=220714 RepID=A0A3F3GVJ6_9LACO|nr:hypothetical protein [Fructobacillus pseudoficulneus]GAP02327.1 hypothetical protein FPFC_012070 [Fructobacillus pseudoficulneus]SEH36389.1 hypothetical protein SAMN05660469_0280 [Fructobacillus pseudoficulneus]
MFANKKILLTTVAIATVLSLGATTFIVNAVSNSSVLEQLKSPTKKSKAAQSTDQDNAKPASTDQVTGNQSGASTQSQSQTTDTSNQGQSNASSNTLTQDDFRDSDDVAYRSIALYGLAHGDGAWQRLNTVQKKGIVMSKVTSQNGPTFVAKATGDSSSTAGAYYHFDMSNSAAPQSDPKPLSFSQANDQQYRASIPEVLNYVNQVGGRRAIQNLKLQLNE